MRQDTWVLVMVVSELQSIYLFFAWDIMIFKNSHHSFIIFHNQEEKALKEEKILYSITLWTKGESVCLDLKFSYHNTFP